MFVRVHALEHVFIHGLPVAWTVFIFCPLLVNTSLLGFGWQVRCSSGFFLNTGTFGFFPLLFFTRYILTPWLFACAGFSAISDLENFLRYPLRSWGKLYFRFFWYFWRGFRSGQKKIPIDPAGAGFFVPSDLCRNLRSCWWVLELLTACL